MTHIPLSHPTIFFPPYLPSTHFLTAPSLPLEVRPLNPSRGLGSAVNSPSGSGQSPAVKRYLVHFGLKMLLVGSHLREIYTFFFGLFTSNNARSRNMRPLSIREAPDRGIRGVLPPALPANRATVTEGSCQTSDGKNHVAVAVWRVT